ncbi:DHS-like NAD/FAD-binding domain-containing protein [Mycena indigotica]|uniref:DHS-like NAD/FAD-binding domain-containing protein n=1 Tax=Mycena indigotica TaxID=2126181 RepID=A0A8H6W2N7_9AGAR|nr:DHS-like NAD/FAD-binding domain-containing protein [Mycena indigotica]KAF7297144.1 DHS-like NAD/FAD-binding domain-containing protein [Mycena indigotica]
MNIKQTYPTKQLRTRTRILWRLKINRKRPSYLSTSTLRSSGKYKLTIWHSASTRRSHFVTSEQGDSDNNVFDLLPPLTSMTLFVPLASSGSGTQPPSSPAFLKTSPTPTVHLERITKAILKARRIVVVCGAGISVQAGIPDFRSPEGLFQTLKRENPKEVLSSGKDLFDASVFQSENTTSLFYQMIARLSELSTAASPTQFHKLLHALETRGRLLRVYTQNIDAIEEKSGLTFGIPPFQEKRQKSRTPKPAPDTELAFPDNVASSSRLPTPSGETTPRCIPLHGTLQTVHCQICNHSFALADHLPAFAIGTPPACPECISMDETRQLVGKRSRGIGRLRPSVVLYNEEHKDGEGVGFVVQRDLMGLSKGKGRSGADLLLVVGTSLRVPGTKRMVREFAKAVRSRGKDNVGGSNSPSPTPQAGEEDQPLKALYLNLDFPVPTREWEGVFDAWIQGDAQVFAEILQAGIDKETKAKEAAVERKRRKEEQSEELAVCQTPKKRKTTSPSKSHCSPKRRKTTDPPTTPIKLLLKVPPATMIKYVPEVVIPCPPRPSIPSPSKSPTRSCKTSSSSKIKSSPVRVRAKPPSKSQVAPKSSSDSDFPPLVRGLQYGLRSRPSSRTS